MKIINIMILFVIISAFLLFGCVSPNSSPIKISEEDEKVVNDAKDAAITKIEAKIDESFLLSAIGIKEFSISEDSIDIIVLQNNLYEGVTLNSVKIGDFEFIANPLRIEPGEDITLQKEIMSNCEEGKTTEFSVFVDYTDVKTGARYTFEPNQKIIVSCKE